jgi:hypothetical protein
MFFSLKNTSPKYDMVLLSSIKLNLSIPLEKMLYDIVDVIYLVTNSDPKLPQNKWCMKYFAWALIDYEKLLWIGGDCLVLTNIDSLFNFPAPAGCYDYWIWNMTSYGATINGDFVLFEPDLQGFYKLTDPYYCRERIDFDGSFLGPVDQGGLQLFYEYKISIFPQHYFYQFPIPPPYSNRGHFVGRPDASIHKVVHFASAFKPWTFGYIAMNPNCSIAWDAGLFGIRNFYMPLWRNMSDIFHLPAPPWGW